MREDGFSRLGPKIILILVGLGISGLLKFEDVLIEHNVSRSFDRCARLMVLEQRARRVLLEKKRTSNKK